MSAPAVPTRAATGRRRTPTVLVGTPVGALVGAVVMALMMVLAGCSGAGDPGPTPPSPADRLAAAKRAADEASSIHLVLSSRDVPNDAAGVLRAEGVGTPAPAFRGKLSARLSGAQADIDVVAVDGDLYLKFPFTPAYVKTDPQTYGAPDPATLFSTDRGITSLLTATTDLAAGDDIRAGSEVLNQITGTLPGEQVVRLLNIGSPDQTYDVTYGLTADSGQLRKASLTGPFFAGSRSTYDVLLDRYGEPVEITRP